MQTNPIQMEQKPVKKQHHRASKKQGTPTAAYSPSTVVDRSKCRMGNSDPNRINLEVKRAILEAKCKSEMAITWR